MQNQFVRGYRAHVRWLKARIRRDEKRLESETSYSERQYLEARIVNDQVAVEHFESRIYWMTR